MFVHVRMVFVCLSLKLAHVWSSKQTEFLIFSEWTMCRFVFLYHIGISSQRTHLYYVYISYVYQCQSACVVVCTIFIWVAGKWERNGNSMTLCSTSMRYCFLSCVCPNENWLGTPEYECVHKLLLLLRLSSLKRRLTHRHTATYMYTDT